VILVIARALVVISTHPENPMTDHSESLSPKHTAQIVRGLLRQRFPATKFSVTTERGSMMSSVLVSWTDGPSAGRVTAITSRFACGTFNGMTDSFDYADTHDRQLLVDGVPYVAGTKYVTTHRHLSPAFVRRLLHQIATCFGVDAPTLIEHGTYWEIEDDTRHRVQGRDWSQHVAHAAGDATYYAGHPA